MKGQITTLLSLTGVLVAGSAAALVNTQVLQSNGASTGVGLMSINVPADSWHEPIIGWSAVWLPNATK